VCSTLRNGAFIWHAPARRRQGERLPPRFVSLCSCSVSPSTALPQQNRLQRPLPLPQHDYRQLPLPLPQHYKHQRPLLRAERTHAKTEETERTGQQVRRRKSGSPFMIGNTGKQGGAGRYMLVFPRRKKDNVRASSIQCCHLTFCASGRRPSLRRMSDGR
jgi:hypothetical protein